MTRRIARLLCALGAIRWPVAAAAAAQRTPRCRSTKFGISPMLSRGSVPRRARPALRQRGQAHGHERDRQSIFRVNTATGATERVVGPARAWRDLAFAADGTMYWTAIEDGILYARRRTARPQGRRT
jgi:hypothetical protein